jgi:hypothetical protein
VTWFAPSQDPQTWSVLQVLFVGGWVLLPGQTTISDNPRVIGYDDKEADGQNGASTTRQGEKLKTFTSTHFLTDEPWPPGAAEVPEDRDYVDDFYQWEGAELLLRQSYAGEKPVALTVYHPDLERQGVDAATVREISGLTDNKDGSGVISVKWKQHREKEPTRGTGGGPKGDDPEQRTESDDTIDRLVEESERLDKEYENL